MIEASKKKAKESICMPLKRMPYKKIKTVHDVLEREGEVRVVTKHHMMFFRKHFEL